MNRLILGDRNNYLIDFRDDIIPYSTCQITIDIKPPSISFKIDQENTIPFTIPNTPWLTLSFQEFTISRHSVKSSYFLFTRTPNEASSVILFYIDSELHSTITNDINTWIIKLLNFDFINFTFANVEPNTIILHPKTQKNYIHSIAFIPLNDMLNITTVVSPFVIPNKKYCYITFTDEHRNLISINNFSLFIK